MYKCIIVDDERNSSELLELQIVKYCSSRIKIIATCHSPIEAIDAIQKLKPDLVFLDIQMPEMSGFELLERMNPIDFEVVFTTAFDTYAVKAFKYNALEYLLKPIDPNELKSSVAKFEVKRKEREMLSASTPNRSRRFALTTSDSLIFINPEEIIYCESNSNYTNFILVNQKKILVSKTLKEIDEILVNFNFFRIHHSHLVNIDQIIEFVRGAGGYVVMSNGAHLTVARSKKDEFFNTFNKF
jgi:two-component system LytT family response regulator